MKICIVDDEPDLVELFTSKLESLGFQVVSFTDPKLALSAIQNEKNFNILITDQNMPSLNGLDLIKEARKTISSLKCFLVSGDGNTSDPTTVVVPKTDFFEKIEGLLKS